MFRLLQWFSPAPPTEKVSDGKSLNGLEAVVNEKVSGWQHGIAPLQPNDHSCIWGVHSFAR